VRVSLGQRKIAGPNAMNRSNWPNGTFDIRCVRRPDLVAAAEEMSHDNLVDHGNLERQALQASVMSASFDVKQD
jgi:hypothetical protein